MAGAIGIDGRQIIVSGTVRASGPAGTFDAGVILGIHPQTGFQRILSSNGLLRDPVGLAADPAGDIYSLDRNRVIRIDGQTGAQQTLTSGGRLIDATDLIFFFERQPARAHEPGGARRVESAR